MKKVILSIVCAMTIFSACEKIVYNAPNTLPGTTNTTPPTVIMTDPSNTATGISLNQQISISFNKVSAFWIFSFKGMVKDLKHPYCQP